MTDGDYEAHEAAYMKMPSKSSAYDDLPLSLIQPGEIGRFMEALPTMGSKKSHKLLGDGDFPSKRSIFGMTMYSSAEFRLDYIEFSRRAPTAGERDLDSMSPGDYIEVLFPTEERIHLCERCDGEGWSECRVCSGEGWDEKDERKCVVCEGEGGMNCKDCEGSQGTRFGTIITLAKTADDYFVMDAVFYSDFYNEEWDRDLAHEGGRAFICDQLSGLLDLVRGPEFQRLLRQEV